MNHESPLEELSMAFSLQSRDPESHDYWNERIIDDIDKKILYIVPAGYTHRDESGETRLYYYKSAWHKAVSINRETNIYPLGEKSHSIKLFSDSQNRYDPYAIKIEIEFYENYTIPDLFTLNKSQDIGFIPKRISKLITKNKEKMTNGKLINLYANLQKGLYFGRIAFPYGEEIINTPKTAIQRFISIMED